jgi:HD-like signal output (HDOD) protein
MSLVHKNGPHATGKLEQVLGDLRKLPLLPAVAQQAVAMANDKNASLQEFSRLIEKDITLASSILKLANSSSYNWSQPIESLDQAVARLGFRECQSLIFAASMGNLYQQVDPLTKGRCAVLWKHCFLTACLCRRLNKDLRFDFHGEEFTAGLLHDLGRILLAVSFPNLFEAADPMDFQETASVRDKENEILQTDHCQLGTHYAQQNRLPGAAVVSIQFHHSLTEARDHRGILGLVATSDHMANHLQRGDKPETYDLRTNPGFAFLAHDWTDSQKAVFERQAPRLLADTVASASDSKPRQGAQAPSLPPTQNNARGAPRSWLGC